MQRRKNFCYLLAVLSCPLLSSETSQPYPFDKIFMKGKEILIKTDKLEVGELHMMDVDFNGRILFLDAKGGQLLLFNQEGGFLRRIGKKGQGPGEFMVPFGLGTDRWGNIIVSDSQSRRISRLDKDGNFITSFIISGPHGAPGPICVDSKNNYYLGAFKFSQEEPTSGKGFLINKYDADGKYLQSFYSRNEAPPWVLNISPFPYLAMDSDDNIYAMQIDAYEVTVLSPEGTVLKTFRYSPPYFLAPDEKLQIDYSEFKTKSDLMKKFSELATSWTKISALKLIEDKYLLIELEMNRLIKGVDKKFMLDIWDKNGKIRVNGIPSDYKFLCTDKDGYLYFLEYTNEEAEEKEPEYLIGKYKLTLTEK